MGKALVLVAVAVAVGVLVYWLAVGRVEPRRDRAGDQRPVDRDLPVPAGLAANGDRNAAAAPKRDALDGPIAPPRTDRERERDAVETRRGPLYAAIREKLGARLAAIRPSDDDPASLEIYASISSSGGAADLLNAAVQTNIPYYGFRHIRIYAPNPPEALERYRLDAEAAVDGAGTWQMFRK